MAAYGSAAAPAYGFQAAKNTTMYPGAASGPARPLPAAGAPSAGIPNPKMSPYAGQVAKNTTGANEKLYQSVPPLSQPTKSVAPTPAPAPAAAPLAAPSTSLYDYTTDPVLLQTQAQAQAAEAEAQAQAAAAQNQLAIQYSDPALALDSTYADTARNNPYGVYSLLNTQEPLDQQALDENLNKSNLFYSGARVNQQGQLVQQYGQKRADAATAEQSAYAQIKATLLAAQQQEHNQVLSAQNDAYNRFLQQLLSNPGALGGGGGTSDGGGGDSSGGSGDAGAGDAFGTPQLDNEVANAFYQSASTPQPPASIWKDILAAANPPPPKPSTGGNSAQVRKNSY